MHTERRASLLPGTSNQRRQINAGVTMQNKYDIAIKQNDVIPQSRTGLVVRIILIPENPTLKVLKIPEKRMGLGK